MFSCKFSERSENCRHLGQQASVLIPAVLQALLLAIRMMATFQNALYKGVRVQKLNALRLAVPTPERVSKYGDKVFLGPAPLALQSAMASCSVQAQRLPDHKHQ